MTLLELLSALTGIVGAFMLALNGERAGWGFVAYLASNVGWIAFGWIHAHWGLVGQQIAFTAASLLGIWRWLVVPRQAIFVSVYRAARPYRSRLGAARIAMRCSR